MFRKLLIVGAALLSTSAVFADNDSAGTRTFTIQGGQGGSYTITVVDRHQDAQPYALTGNDAARPMKYEVQYRGQAVVMVPVPR